MQLKMCTVAIICLSLSAANAQDDDDLGVPLNAIILNEVPEVAKLYFSQNRRLDGSGFNIINEDEEWTPTGLFIRQYGEDTSTVSFVDGLMDFEYYQSNLNVSFSDVTQLVTVGEHRDARQAFAAFAEAIIADLVAEDGLIYDVKTASARINSAFRSVLDIVGNDNFASFLNLIVGSSLSFVMDTTGSMGGEIEAAKARVIEIIERTNGTNSEPLNYVLMPYNDPGYGPLTKTTDAITFINAVNALRANGGGDIPELAMIGILSAAQSSGFRSIVYVFTDAPAKDDWLLDHTIALCLTKKIAVFVFLTGTLPVNDRAVYENVAEQTGGSVIDVPKDEISGATAIMEATTEQGLVILLSASQISANEVTVYVDSAVTSLVVLFTGTFEYVGFTGLNVDSITPLTSISAAELFRMEGLTPGEYKFHFNSNATNLYSVLIRGKSVLGFHTRFRQSEPGIQLKAGIPTVAEMTVYGDASDTDFETFEIVSRSGDVLHTASITADGTRLTVPEFLLPNSLSFVRLTGEHDDEPIVRMDACAITPTVASAKFGAISDMTVKAGETIQITATIKNIGSADEFTLLVSDNQEFVSLPLADANGLVVLSLNREEQSSFTLTITVPTGTVSGVLSKVLLSASATNGSYFIYTTFVVSVIDDVVRCSSPFTPSGGRLTCTPDARSVGSNCSLSCGSEYFLVGDDMITCQPDGTWSPQNLGQCQFLGSQTCIVAGDPHYTSFDGLKFDFQGSCLYTLVETNQDSSLEPVIVQTENGLFYSITHVSWFKQAFITVYGVTIQLKQGQFVLIDGVRITLPRIMFGGNLQILYDGPDVLIKTDFRMEVRLNKQHYFRVSLPASYRDNVFGLCGNYDGAANNDLAIGNVTFDSASAFGNEFEIIGGTNAWCRRGLPDDDEPGCNEAQLALYRETCAALKSSCFLGCADEQLVEALFDECVYDLCALGGNKDIAEGHIFNFATTCAAQGIQICNWREEFDCPPPPCGRNQHFEFRGNPCPNTCIDSSASLQCTSRPKIEGCVCNDGFVLDGDECVRLSECGCAVSGQYYMNGFEFLEEGCMSKCTCSQGALSCVPTTCEEGTECKISSASRQYECLPGRIDVCTAAGDPHYKTLDGTYYDFMGVCEYIMLSTNGTALTDPSRHVTITAQNEHRNGITRVSYVRSVRITVLGATVNIGPGTELTMNGTDLDAEDSPLVVEKRGRRTIVTTRYGLKVGFAGTNLRIEVPSYYTNKVFGLCGNYTGMMEDDFGGLSIESFATGNRYSNGCTDDDSLPDPPVCSDADRAKWSGPEYCGRMNDTTGPFSFCIEFVNLATIIENCIFDACVTDGQSLNDSLQALAEECENRVPCDWEVILGIAPDCPENSEYTCGSVCQDTCQYPTASARCQSIEEYAQCVCSPGYIMNDGVCVEANTCGCVLEDGRYVEQGYKEMAKECEYSVECTGPGSVTIKENPCSEDSQCLAVEEDTYQCVPNEYAYTLVYGAVHFKTFDDRYFDFRGDCAYLLVGHNSPVPEKVPSFRIFLLRRPRPDGNLELDGVRLEGSWDNWSSKVVLIVKRGGQILLDGQQKSIGTTIPPLNIRMVRGYVSLVFDFGMEVHYDGYDWIRVDVSPYFMGKTFGLGGNYNGRDLDDFSIEDMMFLPDRWGDRWIEERLSSKTCYRETPPEIFECAFRTRYQRSCDCGMLTDSDGPFAVCHDKIDPRPFMQSCVSDACYWNGSPAAMYRTMMAYRTACLGKGIFINLYHIYSSVDTAVVCPDENSYFSNCTQKCQPTCGGRDITCFSTGECEQGCVCNDGFILSNGKCVPEEKCGCMKDGVYFEHGVCDVNEDCTQSCTCVYGSWNCENTTCNEAQYCSIMDGVKGCYWKDPCKYENGGCSDICGHNEKYETVCSCNPGRILTADDRTCVEISNVFFQDGMRDDTCGVAFSSWKSEYKSWQEVYVPQWQKELQDYKNFVERSIVSSNLDVCRYAWTDWYDLDDPAGCGDDESLDNIRVKYPYVCENPITAQVRLADGREARGVFAEFEVTDRGVMCRNADQKRGVSCPDLAVRFLCRVQFELEKKKCDY